MPATALDATPLADFAAALGPRLRGSLRTDALHRALYATDASMYEVPPLAVVLPRTADDVQAAVEEAARFGLPVLPRGSGSSLAGSAVAAAVVVDTTRWLDGVTALDPEARTVTVQPGVVLDRLNARLEAHGLQFGPDPASSNRATLGGMVGTNATGAHSIRYGSVVDHVLEAEALLHDGTRVTLRELDAAGWAAKLRAGGEEGRLYRELDALIGRERATVERDTPPHWRRAGGYRLERMLGETKNPAHLLCGSEGTLAFVTSVKLGLVPAQTHTGMGVVHFDSRRAALEAVTAILETDPSAVELFDRLAIHRARAVEEYRPKLHFVQGDPAALLFVEYEGASDAEVRDGLVRLTRVLGAGATITEVLQKAQLRDVWDVRKVGLGLGMSARLPVQCVAFVEDAAVPVEHLPDYISRLERVMADNGTDAVVYAHASAGCLHVRPFIDTKDPAEVERMVRIGQASADLVREYGGLIASEHGDGLARSWLAQRFFGDALYGAYVGLKRAFDPHGRLNPNRVVEAPPMDQHLRMGPEYAARVRLPETALDWRRQGGLDGAIERCNGSAVCRKLDAGAMCPSFMATREEKDSTRGRANALRHALTGELDLTGPEVAEAMSLCVGCKACQSECPAQVDLAKLKTEWLAQRWKTEKPSLRTRLFAHLPRIARRTSGLAAMAANRMGKVVAFRKVLETRYGITMHRPLPPFAVKPFRETGVSPEEADVVLMADTFARFQEPGVAQAALRVLQASGLRVHVASYHCCGRTYLSTGFVDPARRTARALVDSLAPFARRGVPVVGLEPSCLLTLRDEAFALLPDHPDVQAVADAARTFEEFVAAEAERFRPLFAQAPPGKALLHAHCHQKALSGAGFGVQALAVAGVEAQALDTSCCGMAGAFGYEVEHLGASLAMAERRLAPAMRDAPEGVALVAPGTSCRSQVKHVAGKRPLHPAEVLAGRLR